MAARKSASEIRPRSSSNSGCSPSRSAILCIARPRAPASMPISSWSAMKDASSGVVKTPPKSEITALIATLASIRPDDLVEATSRGPIEAEAHRHGVATLWGPSLRFGLAIGRDPAGSRVGLRPELDAQPTRCAPGVVLDRHERVRGGGLLAMGVDKPGDHEIVAMSAGLPGAQRRNPEHGPVVEPRGDEPD